MGKFSNSILEKSLNNNCIVSSVKLYVDGHSIQVMSYGVGRVEAATLVFLHEGLGSISQWGQFPFELAQYVGCNAIVYDRFGHGLSDSIPIVKGTDFLEQEARTVLPEIIKALNIKRPILYGHSDGGSIALLSAAYFPNQFLGVITEAAHVFVEPVSITGVKATLERYIEGGLKSGLEKHHGENTDSMFYSWATVWLSSEFQNWSIPMKTLGQINCLVLALQGEDDEYGTGEQLQRIEEGIGSGVTKVCIPNCAHIPHNQARDSVMEHTTKFIRDLIKPTSIK